MGCGVFYIYDGQGNIVRSIDILGEKEYNYLYEDGKITRAAEYEITVGSNEIITDKVMVHSVIYTYDGEGNLTEKMNVSANGIEDLVRYEHREEGSPVNTGDGSMC